MLSTLTDSQPPSHFTVEDNNMTSRLFPEAPMSHDTHTSVKGEQKKKLQVAQVLSFMSTLKSRLGAWEAGEGEINWGV